MLNFNEGKVCDAIVRRLEKRAGSARANLCWPEKEAHPHPVEIAFTISDQLFALEHTGIEPFKGHVRMRAKAEQHFKPIQDALNGTLGTTAVFELQMPVSAFKGMKRAKVRRVQDAIIAWVKATAPTLPPRLYGDYRGAAGPVTPPGVPFSLSLYRFEPAIVPGHFFHIKHVVTNSEQRRIDRITEAVERKFPKLAAWKDSGARSIFVLEDDDIFLTNEVIVAETYLPLANARTDRPDETYLVSTYGQPWHAWPLLIDSKCLFDFSESPRWEIDPASLDPLTKR